MEVKNTATKNDLQGLVLSEVGSPLAGRATGLWVLVAAGDGHFGTAVAPPLVEAGGFSGYGFTVID